MSPHSTPVTRAPRIALGLLGAIAVIVLHVSVWKFTHQETSAPEISGPAAGVAYNGYGRWEHPKDQPPHADRIARDLALIAPYTKRVRTYSSTEMPSLPEQAKALGLSVTLGAWLDTDPLRNQREVEAAVQAAQAHSHVDRIILGNETQLTGRLQANDLYRMLDQTRRRLRAPVSTAEPWHVWLAQPELARHVDFITVHLLPYWEGVPAEHAVGYALDRLTQVQKRFPHLPVVIGEIGWPSHGAVQGQAQASPQLQAAFVRTFVQQAQALGLDYYLMEAIDQPWKRSLEGQAGGHWGLWDAARVAKFSWQGPIAPGQHALAAALAAGALGLILALPVLFGLAALRLHARLILVIGVQVVAYAIAWFAGWPFADYPTAWELAMALGLVGAIGFLGMVILALLFEFCELFWPERLQFDAPKTLPRETETLPKVSLHLACSNEPPAMVIQTIKHVLAIDWPALEIIVVDNNTRDPGLVAPIAAFVHACEDPRLRFFSLSDWQGFKAGALNFALAQSDPEAQWIGVVDADYQVAPEWLQQVCGYFKDPTVGLIQAPQAHRDPLTSRFSRFAYWEFEGFFRIGMHHRNQRNAIIQHGTMTLIRAQTLRRLGGWNIHCICEDSELGLRILQTGARAVYLDQVLGTGLLPDDFAAYRRQRRRWALGAMQILKTHAKSLIGRSPLSLAQRYHFVAGWLPWIGDALHLALTIGAIVWSLATIIAPGYFPLPTPILLVPLVTLIFFRFTSGLALYRRRVGCGWGESLGASLAGMALSHIIARGIYSGLCRDSAAFEVTRKTQDQEGLRATPIAAQRTSPHARFYPVHEEAALLMGLAMALGVFWALPPAVPIENRMTWSIFLLLQALPYVAAIACALLSALGRASHHQIKQALTETVRTGRWASPRPQRSGLTVETMPLHPPPRD